MSYVESVDLSTSLLSEAAGSTSGQNLSGPHHSPLPVPVPQSLTQKAGNDQPKRKRRKIPVACDECRKRKTRCDGIRPVCAPCESKKRGSCVYQEDILRTTGWATGLLTLKPPIQRFTTDAIDIFRYTSKLERRVRALEGQSSKNHAVKGLASESDLLASSV